ncbi:MAG: hypothetical protein WC965_02255 [Thiohalomonadaceae bacterium]
MKRKGFRRADLHAKIKSDPEFAIHLVEAQSTDYGELLREYNSLRATNERLEKALREIAESRSWCGTDHDTDIYWRFADMAERALAASEGQP